LSVVSCIVFNNDQLLLHTFYVTVFHIQVPLEGCHGLMKCMYVCVFTYFRDRKTNKWAWYNERTETHVN